ncbi:RNA polymerase sigma factor [Bacteroidales bacterium OttesenSCG-928-A17]|nr:RNA polymerase sigma factor [Bacteroidales bacterium OttesenSCG-928-A17]
MKSQFFMLYLFFCFVIKMYMEIIWFKSAFVPLRQKLYSFALKMVGNEEEAEDIVQETFLKLWSNRNQLKEVKNPEGFAMQVCKNACIDKLRQQKNRVDSGEFDLNAEHYTPYTYSEQKNATDLIRRIIEDLPGLQKNIIKMRDIEGYELEEIAEITGTLVTAVRANLSRARKKVRDEFVRVNEWKMKMES